MHSLIDRLKQVKTNIELGNELYTNVRKVFTLILKASVTVMGIFYRVVKLSSQLRFGDLSSEQKFHRFLTLGILGSFLHGKLYTGVLGTHLDGKY